MKLVTKSVLALAAVSMLGTPAMAAGRLRTFKGEIAQSEVAQVGRIRSFKAGRIRSFKGEVAQTETAKAGRIRSFKAGRIRSF